MCKLTVIIFYFVQEADALQMSWCGHRQSEYVTDGLVEAWVGSITEGHRLLFVLQEVLDVSHLVVDCDQVVHGHHGALFDPEGTNTHNEP